MYSPCVFSNRENFASFRCVVQARTDSVYKAGSYSSKTMTFSWIKHVRQLCKLTILKFISMITWLWTISRSTCYKYLAIICLNRTESNRYVEINIQKFASFFTVVYIIEVHSSLIKFEEVNSVDLLLLLLRLNHWLHGWFCKTLIQSLISVSWVAYIASTHKVITWSSLSNFRSSSDQLNIWSYSTVRIKPILTIVITITLIESYRVHHFILRRHSIHILLVLFLSLLLRNSM